ncbi:MAG: GDSL-type esterase/lipase family protein, partial [Cyanobacteria bacterium J06632_3]
MNAPLKIVALGDSITNALEGYNSYRRDLWNQLIQAGYDVDFVGSKNNAQGNNPFPDSTFDPDHEGHAGWRIDEIVNGRGGNAGLSGWLAGYTPDIALVHLGTNDALQRNTAESSANELNQTIDILRQDNPDIVIFLAQV